jgi:hypothetical protein
VWCSDLRVAELERDTPIILLHLCSVKKLDKAALIVAVLELFNSLDAQYGVDDTAQEKRSSTGEGRRRPTASALLRCTHC